MISNFIEIPALIILLITGIKLSCMYKFKPQRNLFITIRNLFTKNKHINEGEISPFSSLMTILAATVGTGNIAGVAVALTIGGPGALFYMWLSAFFGMATQFTECALGVKYREKNKHGEMIGGTMYALKNGLHARKTGLFLGILFSIFTVIASFGIGNLIQADSVCTAVLEIWSIPEIIPGIIMSVITFITLIGGIKRISKVTSYLVPTMAGLYIVAGLIVIICNYKRIPESFCDIFKGAFGIRGFAGGTTGTLFMLAAKQGISKGVFSNESGLGSSSIPAAAAETNSHIEHGYVGMCGTFFDTIIICTITGLAITTSGVMDYTNLEGVNLTIVAFSSVLGCAGGYIITIGMILFAYSSILGWEYIGEKALEFLVKKRFYCYIYRVVFAGTCIVGAVFTTNDIWEISAIANSLMIIPNVIAIWALAPSIKEDISKGNIRWKRKKK